MYLVIQVQLWLMGNLTFNRVFPVCLKQNTKLPNRKRVQENLITEWWLKFHRFLTQSYCMTWENIEHNPCIYIYSPKAFCNLSTIFFFFLDLVSSYLQSDTHVLLCHLASSKWLEWNAPIKMFCVMRIIPNIFYEQSRGKVKTQMTFTKFY